MKYIGIVTNTNSSPAVFLKGNIEEIYRDFVVINNYYLNELKDTDKINDDVVLIMGHAAAVTI